MITQQKLWVFDVDGTVCDSSHRSVFLQQSNPDWDAFYEAPLMMKDSPMPEAARYFENGVFKLGPHVFLTARTEQCRAVTLAWLIQHGFASAKTLLYMKPDIIRFQRAAIFKPEALASISTEFNGRYQLVMVDDHPGVLAALSGSKFHAVRSPDCWHDSKMLEAGI